MKLIAAETVDHARTIKRAMTQTRQQRIADAIDDFQSAVLEVNTAMRPTYAQSMKVGAARKHLLAEIASRDRAERLEA